MLFAACQSASRLKACTASDVNPFRRGARLATIAAAMVVAARSITIRRFVSSAAANGIDVFRLHDPLNDLANLQEAADATGLDLVLDQVVLWRGEGLEFPVAVNAAKFPTDQRLAQTSDLQLEIENTGSEQVPNLAVTIWTGDEKGGGMNVTALVIILAVAAAFAGLMVLLWRRGRRSTPPARQGDYAYLLHIVRSLKSTGKGACILPHGVLFRGNAEADVRRIA